MDAKWCCCCCGCCEIIPSRVENGSKRIYVIRTGDTQNHVSLAIWTCWQVGNYLVEILRTWASWPRPTRNSHQHWQKKALKRPTTWKFQRHLHRSSWCVTVWAWVGCQRVNRVVDGGQTIIIWLDPVSLIGGGGGLPRRDAIFFIIIWDSDEIETETYLSTDLAKTLLLHIHSRLHAKLEREKKR